MLSSDGVHDIHPYVSLFVFVLFRKVSPGNILMRYVGQRHGGRRWPTIFINNYDGSIDLPLLRGGMRRSLMERAGGTR